MRMMRSTRQTSTSGVTLMSLRMFPGPGFVSRVMIHLRFRVDRLLSGLDTPLLDSVPVRASLDSRARKGGRLSEKSDPRVRASNQRVEESNRRVRLSNRRVSVFNRHASVSDRRVEESNPRVEESNQRLGGSNRLVGESNRRVGDSNWQVRESDPRLGDSN
jgi:hypothetical protein